MAPTETLAEQHFLTVEPLCAQLGVRCVLLTGSIAARKIRDEIANGVAQIAVGTHALIQRDVEFADPAVAVVDEQHRFGVEQRKALSESRPSRSWGGADDAAPEGTVRWTGPESDVASASSAGGGARLRRAGAAGGQGR